MTRDQKVVAIGAASGVATMIVAVSALFHLWPIKTDLVEVSARIAYTLQANAFAILPVLFSIITVGNNRFFSDAIDPMLHKENQKTLINGRVADNNLQQYLLFLIGTLSLSVNLTSEQMRVIPASAIVFFVARFAFWIGYRIHPLYRAFGMAATAYLNVGLLAFALWETLGTW